VGYGRRWELIALGVAAVGGLGDQRASGQEASTSWLGAEATVELRGAVGDVVVRAGVGPRALAIFQTLRRMDADRLALAGYDAERSRQGLAIGGHALAGARAPLGSRAWIDLTVRGELAGVPVAGALVAAWSLGGGGGLGVAF